MATAAKIGIGSAINRVDGVEKVTGTARYAAEHPVENLLYGYIVEAAIAKGRIVSIDEEAARAVPGVVEVSIGHALIADALELGIAETVRDYQRCIQNAFSASKMPLARPGGGTSPLPR